MSPTPPVFDRSRSHLFPGLERSDNPGLCRSERLETPEVLANAASIHKGNTSSIRPYLKLATAVGQEFLSVTAPSLTRKSVPNVPFVVFDPIRFQKRAVLILERETLVVCLLVLYVPNYFFQF